MFNHSCLPNCLWYIIGDYLFIYVCSSKIKAGEELTISYCPLWISSIVERTNLLKQFGIQSCRCVLCLHDRSVEEQLESLLKKFAHHRALARQTNLCEEKKMKYFHQLKEHYGILSTAFRSRPIGFIREFDDVESIAKAFPTEHDGFLDRFSEVCSFKISRLLVVPNPLVFFGPHLQVNF